MSGWPGGFGRRWRHVRARHDRIREAINAVRDNAQGKTRAEIRERSAAEFRARGLTPPADPVLDHMTDRILSARDLPSQIRLTARGLGILAEVGGQAVREAREAFQGAGTDTILDTEPLFVRCDRSRPAADVILDAGAQQRLTPPRNPSPVPEFSEIFVVLAGGGANDGGQVEIYLGEHRVGTLTTTDSAEFRAILAPARSQDRPVAGEAIRDRDAGGSWALHVYRPEPG